MAVSHTVTIRLARDLAAGPKTVARRSGRTKGEIVRRHLEKARARSKEKSWMELAGAVHGPRDLSTREGFGPR